MELNTLRNAVFNNLDMHKNGVASKQDAGDVILQYAEMYATQQVLDMKRAINDSVHRLLQLHSRYNELGEGYLEELKALTALNKLPEKEQPDEHG